MVCKKGPYASAESTDPGPTSELFALDHFDVYPRTKYPHYSFCCQNRK